MTQCALWYWSHYSAYVDIKPSEEQAAAAAVHIQASGNASVAGVQFPDGRCIPRDEWAAYEVAWERLMHSWDEEEARRVAAPPRPTRRVRVPFGGGKDVDLDASLPDWVGE